MSIIFLDSLDLIKPGYHMGGHGIKGSSFRHCNLLKQFQNIHKLLLIVWRQNLFTKFCRSLL
jgi:hypothetical protein